jgi:hypothetical protein
VTRVLSNYREWWNTVRRFVKDVFLFVLFPSHATDHLPKESFRTVVREHGFEFRTDLLAVDADAVDEPLIILEIA